MYRMKEHKLEICDNVYGNMIIMCSIYLVVVCFALVVVQKIRLKEEKIWGGIIPKRSLEGAPHINFVLWLRAFVIN